MPLLSKLVRLSVLGLLAGTLWLAYRDIWLAHTQQVAGADYSCLWAGAKAALSQPARLYDFRHITDLQHWPLGPRAIRPFIYPPSALLIFIPFALIPSYWAGFGLWVAATGGLFAWAATTARCPWWAVLLPAGLLVADCGQVTFLVGGLATAGLMLRHRPILAGVLLGVAAAVKPQLLALAPLALIAESRWRSLAGAGLTGLSLCGAASAIWGPEVWLDWLGALGRFQQQVIFANPRLVEDAVTPYAALVHLGYPGAWAWLLAPLAIGLVWFAFRRGIDAPDRLIAFFGATLLVTPYAMNYELALLAPAAAFYLRRLRDPRGTLYALAAVAHLALPWSFWSVAPMLGLPLLRKDRASKADTLGKQREPMPVIGTP